MSLRKQTIASFGLRRVSGTGLSCEALRAEGREALRVQRAQDAVERIEAAEQDRRTRRPHNPGWLDDLGLIRTAPHEDSGFDLLTYLIGTISLLHTCLLIIK